jgi:DNA-binding winged helix-turn-helix (wHTH) protein
VRLRFAECALDTTSRELLRDGAAVHVSPKAFQLLEALLGARPAAVSRADLHARLWPATFVHEANLPNLIAEVRAALGDDARRPRFVRTVHGHGYAFCAEAVPEGAAAAAFAYRLDSARGSRVLGEGEHVLGRGATCAVRIDSRSVSRRHAVLRTRDGEASIEDLGSRNGTYVRGRKVEGSAVLRSGDEVRVGSVTMTFSVSPAGDSTAATEAPSG